MALPNNTSLQETIRQLKEIITNLQGEDHESSRLVRQIEALATEIERKSSTRQSLPLASRTPASQIRV